MHKIDQLNHEVILGRTGSGVPEDPCLAFTLDLHELLTKHAVMMAQGRSVGIQIAVTLKLAEMLSQHDGANNYVHNLRRLDDLNQDYIEQIAKVCHQVNRAYCLSLGDTSQPYWDDAPDWQKSSACNGVLFHILNPDAGPVIAHEAWLEEKTSTGWKYGPVKDAEKKEHPCFLPYYELPREQQTKDALFIAVVKAMT